MMTKLQQVRRARRIGEKRRKRRIAVKHKRVQERFVVRHMRSILSKHIASRPKPELVRAGKQTLGTRIKNFFRRKPTI